MSGDKFLESVFLEDLQKELVRARRKFPDQTRETSLLALVEEVGELAQAHLQKRDEGRIFEEAVQVAVMAMRVVTE